MKKCALIFITVLCFTVAGISGCASQQKKKTITNFDDKSKLYGRMLRWKEYEAATNLMRNPDGEQIEYDLSLYNDLRLVKYEIKKVAFNEEEMTAMVEAEISYYFDTQNKVKTIRDLQNWWYSEEAETWFLNNGFPGF